MSTHYFTTLGPVRRSCGHRHRSTQTALNCLERDRAGCRSQGGYSDRRLVRMPVDHSPAYVSLDSVHASPDHVGQEVRDDVPQWWPERT
jgi:hypothetical protein